MTVFDVEPSLSRLHLFLVSKQKRCFWKTKNKSIFNMALFEGGLWCQTKTSWPPMAAFLASWLTGY